MNESINRRSFIQRAGLGAGLFLSGCGRPRGAGTGPAPSVVILVLDTVRARSCSGWGFHRNTTPCLQQLAGHATRYAHAISTAPWTLPSHVSMFTGEYTCQHGTRGYVYHDGSGAMRMREGPMAEKKETLAEHLFHAGYATALFSANSGYMAPYYNLDQGFETYHVERVPGLDLIEKAVQWLDREPRRPFFLFCNVMDAHSPYHLAPCPDTLPEPVSQDTTLLDAFRVHTLQNNAPLDTALAAAVSAQYELGVGNADRAAGKLMTALQERGLYEDTLFIVVSDHGEYLGEHMLVEHSKDVYEEAVHVPLLVKLPRQARAGVVDSTRSLVQLPATVLSVAGLARPEGYPPPLAESTGTWPLLAENYYSRDWDVKDPRWKGRFNRVRTALYDGSWKFIQSSDGRNELYHLGRDPLEQVNCVNTENAVANALRSRCKDARKALQDISGGPVAPPDGSSEPSPAEQDALRALGYL